VTSLSCTSPGNCSAGGYYHDAANHYQGFAATETRSTWGKARELAATLNAGGNAQVNSVSCASAGNCAAGGYYHDAANHYQGFVAAETRGTWGKAREVAVTLNAGDIAQVNSVSCASAGNCAAGGYYADSMGVDRPFVVNDTGGSWGAAVKVPGTGSPSSAGLAGISSVSCQAPEICLAAGDGPPFVSAEGQPTSTSLRLSASRLTYGKEQTERLRVAVRPQRGGIPAGTVTITSGTVTICRIRLAADPGSCVLTARQLPVGTDTLTATYSGNPYYLGSAASKNVAVVR
jgi:hypothetical protein